MMNRMFVIGALAATGVMANAAAPSAGDDRLVAKVENDVEAGVAFARLSYTFQNDAINARPGSLGFFANDEHVGANGIEATLQPGQGQPEREAFDVSGANFDWLHTKTVVRF